MDNTRVMDLFPIPFYIKKINNRLIEQHKNYLLNLPKIHNTGNLRSEDAYIFEHPLFLELKNNINENIKNYINILYPNFAEEIYITQSWANYTQPNEHHHRHSHPNSFVSGVYYINAIKNEDQIEIFRHNPLFNFALSHNQFNNYNSSNLSVLIETDDLILFPSSLNHCVPTTVSKEVRVSIAFNTFIKGNLGSEMESTALYLR